MLNVNRYKISEIAIDDEGQYWVLYIGPIQGNENEQLGTGHVRFKKLADAMKFLKKSLKDNEKLYKSLITKKEN